jgi:hypothetical protein
MKKNNFAGLLFLLLLITTSVCSAQNNRPPDDQREKIEAQKEAFITERLQLTSEEAQKFWPLYNQYNNSKEELTKLFFNDIRRFKPNDDAMSDKDASELADNYIRHAQKMLDIQKEYHLRFKEILPPKKLLKLYNVEREFQRMLLKRLGERKMGRP